MWRILAGGTGGALLALTAVYVAFGHPVDPTDSRSLRAAVVAIDVVVAACLTWTAYHEQVVPPLRRYIALVVASLLLNGAAILLHDPTSLVVMAIAFLAFAAGLIGLLRTSSTSIRAAGRDALGRAPKGD